MWAHEITYFCMILTISQVALFIAAHFGHVDLALSLMKQGIRPDEAIGDHPSRLWCRTPEWSHIDSHKASRIGKKTYRIHRINTETLSINAIPYWFDINLILFAMYVHVYPKNQTFKVHVPIEIKDVPRY